MANDKTASENICGVNIDGPMIPLGRNNNYTHTLFPQTSRGCINSVKKVLPEIFMGYVLRVAGDWPVDLLIADREDLEDLFTSEVLV